MMASRWAYEALTVHQFKKNDYQSELFDLEWIESNVIYDMQFLIPALEQEVETAKEILVNDPGHTELKNHLRTVRKWLSSIYLAEAYPGLEQIQQGKLLYGGRRGSDYSLVTSVPVSTSETP